MAGAYFRSLPSAERNVGVNWNAGLMRWQPYVDARGKAYPLSHLHPFRYVLPLAARSPSNDNIDLIEVAVGFGMHCFTRKTKPFDSSEECYHDARESRTFCQDRYVMSKRLPAITRSLSDRRRGFAKEDNFVTLAGTRPKKPR